MNPEDRPLLLALFREGRELFMLLRSGGTNPATKTAIEDHMVRFEGLLEQIEPGCLEDGWEPQASSGKQTPRPGAVEQEKGNVCWLRRSTS